MVRRNLLAVSVAGLCMTTTFMVQAKPVQHEGEVSILGSYIKPDTDRVDDYGTAIRGMYSQRLSQHWWLEPQFFAGILETGVDGGTDYYQQGLGADFNYRLFGAETFSPYVSIGGGVSRNDVFKSTGNEFNGYANAALGVISSSFSKTGLRLRADARYLWDAFEEDYSDLHFSLGLTVPIGATRTRIVEKTVVIEKPIVVEKSFADSDGDGVVDGVDQCPNTLEGLEVNAVGCVETNQAQTVVLQGVTFEFNSDRLTANAKDILISTADALKGQTDLKVELAGYTDSQGSADYNRELSQKRANAVRNYLLSLGVAPQQLTAKGYGEANPVRSNDTEEGRERNRRVEFNVVSDAAGEGV
ncbi:OmpA family protein [Marinobacter sp. SBS5]|uniref:OmpA family protein n=1 Tax=Marinobacter sp. SBS5 TaxID=3401754 RepID=UPI003AAF815F